MWTLFTAPLVLATMLREFRVSFASRDPSSEQVEVHERRKLRFSSGAAVEISWERSKLRSKSVTCE